MMEQGTQEARALSEALRESEERLRLVQAAGGVGSVDFDLRTGMVWRSDEYIALHGMPADTPRRDRYSRDWLDRVHPDDRQQVQAWLTADAAAPCEFEHEYRIVRGDTGETRWLISRGRVTADAEGRPLRLLSMQTDITDRKRAELDIAFRADLSDALRRIGDPVEVLRTAAARIGMHLRADYACFGEIDPGSQWAEVHAAWASEDGPDMLGRFPLSDFSPEMVARLTAGQAVMLPDIGTRADVSVQVRQLGVRAILDVPIVRDGRLVAVLAVYQRTPRAWHKSDIDIAWLVAERAGEAVERAQAERALRASEERMRLAIAGTGIGTFDMDVTTGTIIWSDTAFQLLGLPVAPDGRATLLDWLARLHPDEMTRTPALLAEAAMRPGPWEITHRIVRADTGETRWMQALGVIIGAVDSARSIGVVIDVTERKRFELRQAFQLGLAEKLRTATSTRAATEAIAAMIAAELGVDSAGFVEVDIASRTAWVIAGHGRVAEKLAHQPWSFAGTEGPLRGAARADLMAGRTFVLADLATDPRTAPIAAAAQGMMGARGLILVPLMRGGLVSTLLYVQSATPRAWTTDEIALVEDAAARTWEALERLRAEDAVRRANSALADQVAAAVAEREAALQQLHQRQKLETIGQLTGGIAHDFNNLLTPITGALDLLQRRLGEDPRLGRLIAGALQSADRARILIQRLLGFARRQPLNPVPLDLGALIDNMRDLLASSIGPTIRLTVDIPADLPMARADPNQLELAVLNLCVNARDAMPEGGQIAIAASAEDAAAAPAELGLARGRYVRLSVSDTGTGMDEDTRRRAVEPFFSTKTKDKGTGLGLSMVHGLAAQLGGALAIASRPGAGTSITLWLPLAAGSWRPAATAPHARLQPARPLSVLLVDDEPLVRMSTAEMLDELGHHVAQAGHARDALALLDERPFDLLITDYMMPDVNGLQLAATATGRRPDMPVLIVTGYMGLHDRDDRPPVLIKPFTRDELERAVTRAIGLRALT